MTGPLNPRRYDLGELRDAARDPSDRPGTDGSPPERPDGGRPDSATSTDGEERAVPVEPTTPRPTQDSPHVGDSGRANDPSGHVSQTDGQTPRSGGQPPRTEERASRSDTARHDAGHSRSGEPQRRADPERTADAADPDRRRAAGEPRDTNVAADAEPQQPETASDHGRAATDASEQREPADEIESYLRSRHRRRSDETRRSERQSQTTGDRATSRPPERRQASPAPEASEDGRAPNAAAFLTELSGPDLSKPYLDRLPDAYTAQLEVFDWLEELLTVAGHDATLSALEYYESIGWISERSREELEDVASGLSTPGAETAAPSLGVDDHRESLLYIARLAHRQNG